MLAVTMNRNESNPLHHHRDPIKPSEHGACCPTTSLELSPDSVMGGRGPSAAFVDMHLLRIGKGQGLNVPPIHTPHYQSRKQSSLTKQQLDCLPQVPSIPKPAPLASTCSTRRVQSDNLHRRGRNINGHGKAAFTNDRRSIFGLYFAEHDSAVRSNRSYSVDGGSVIYSHEAARNRARAATGSSPPPTPTQHIRSSSGSILETTILQAEPVDYRMFAPPPEHATTSAICSRFATLEEEAPTVLLDLERKSLPPLPSPLQRFCSDPQVSCGHHSNMHGMYPLMTPISILRPSSFSSGPPTNSTNFQQGNTMVDRKTVMKVDSFNLTESYRASNFYHTHVNAKAPGADAIVNAGMLDKQRSSSSIDDASTTSGITAVTEPALRSVRNTSSLQNVVRGVRFDPRVTVTEFEDPVERVWYGEYELERLKRETILIAQKYLLTHPMEAERYNRAKLDPITGTYRKRALFSLPVLSSSTISSEGDDSGTGSTTTSAGPGISSQELQEVSKSQVKRILIVDPNPAIVALFCKSMTSMFPTAELATAQSAERALKLVKERLDGSTPSKYERMRGTFDIIVVEQSLFPNSPVIASHKREHSAGESTTDVVAQPPLELHQGTGRIVAGGENGMTSNSSMPDFCNPTIGRAGIHFPNLLKPGSFFQQPHGLIPGKPCARTRVPRCGADLIRSIARLAQLHDYSSPLSGSSPPNVSSPFQWKPLVIGVSMQPDRDAKALQQAGADIIWGKPIPRVGIALRNQLLKALLAKRRGGK